jgi:hypothetical protein
MPRRIPDYPDALLNYRPLIPISSDPQLNRYRHLRLVAPRQDGHISLLVDSGVWGRIGRSLQRVSYVSKSGIVAVWDRQNRTRGRRYAHVQPGSQVNCLQTYGNHDPGTWTVAFTQDRRRRACVRNCSEREGSSPDLPFSVPIGPHDREENAKVPTIESKAHLGQKFHRALH